MLFVFSLDDSEKQGYLPLRGHSLSWSNENNSQKLKFIKTKKIWRPEDPRQAKNDLFFR